MPLDLVGSKVMTVYVAAIKDRGIAAFYAENGAAAMVRVRDRLFRDDLMVLATDGLPLWDGMADIQVRPAFPEEEEEARWRASRAKAIPRDVPIDGLRHSHDAACRARSSQQRR
jgi:hypothetical protein